MRWWSDTGPRHRNSAENRQAGPVRGHRTNPSCNPRLASSSRAAFTASRTFRLDNTLGSSHRWVERAGLANSAYGTHSLRRTKAAQIYKKTGNLRAVQLLLGHTKLESTVRYLGIEVDDALSISEQVEL